MIKKLLIVFGVLIFAQGAYALNIVYPKNSGVTINSPSTFFVCSANPNLNLSVNNVNVQVHPSGGFVFPVKLSQGINYFQIKSGNEVINYKIFRRNSQSISSDNLYQNPKLIEYSERKIGKIVRDNAVLRSTPIDGGINRISHLPENTEIVIDGEQKAFYRVVLGVNKKGWISKSEVKFITEPEDMAELKGINYIDGREYYKYIFKVSKRVPWVIEEDNGLKIYLYNLKDLKDNTFALNFQKNIMLEGKGLLGYDAQYDDNELIIKVRKPIKINRKHPLKDIKIVVDAGHGGNEIGTTGCLGDKEKDLNLKYALELEEELKARGARVIMTRTSDSFLSLYERVNIAKNEEAVVFISLHANALPDNIDPTNVHGTEIYYYYNQAKPLAKTIMDEISKISGASNNGIIQQSFAVVRNTSALSLLIEVGYMINPADNYMILSEDYRKKTVKAIADGLEKYFLNNN